jgi:hypothetical protein
MGMSGGEADEMSRRKEVGVQARVGVQGAAKRLRGERGACELVPRKRDFALGRSTSHSIWQMAGGRARV